MRSLLDQILDRMEECKPPLVVIELTNDCEHPHQEAFVSYQKGCRCSRCTYSATSTTLIRRRAQLAALAARSRHTPRGRYDRWT